MSETAQQYSQRILGHIEGKDALKSQSIAAKKLECLIKGVPASKLRKRPTPDKWSLGAPGTPIQAYDQDAWAAVGNYAKRDPRKSIEQFRAMREANLSFYKSLRTEQWKQSGMHSERGEESIERIARMIAGHDINHILQIEKILVAKK
jgi:hypothetical protein